MGWARPGSALQVAADLRDDFADGVYFVNLAPISDPGLVAATIAQALDVRERGGQPLIERLNEYLRGKQLLLVLDNFEQVVEAAPLVGALLAAAPGLKVLVTSREPLHLAGEHEYAVPPLAAARSRTHLPPLDRWSQYAAVQLFLARAQAVKADFVVTNDKRAGHGRDLPAAGRAAAGDRAGGGAGQAAPAAGAAGAPRSALEAADRRCAGRCRPASRPCAPRSTGATTCLIADEQALFRRLGVFVGGCTLEAAEAVCNADGDLPLDVLDGLAALVDKSLLKQAEGAAGEPRFTMLETIREYALERLAASGETNGMLQRHAEYFLALAEAAEPAACKGQRSGSG